MTYQIVEFDLDKNDAVIRCKPIPYPFSERPDAVAKIADVIARYERSGYDAKQDSWWANALNGDRMRFVIEGA